MNDFLVNLSWQFIKRIVLIGVVVAMFYLLRMPSSVSHKALRVGGGFFIATIFFNVVGLIQISDYLAVLGFVIITFALIRLFWVESKD